MFKEVNKEIVFVKKKEIMKQRQAELKQGQEDIKKRNLKNIAIEIK